MVKTEESKIYELGYHLVPYLPTEELDKTVTSKLKDRLSALGGVVLSELNPTLFKLSYPITKVINNKHTKFFDSYFGALRFSLPPNQAPGLEQELSKDDLVVRHLIVVVDSGEMALPKRPVSVSNSVRREEAPFEIERLLPEKEEEKPALSSEELDQEIDKLVEPTV